ncbi:LysR family transcriptional regulator [Desulfitobacterium hafniense]|uniref:LysR family transcriptional regulator n=1 Tax=Desulfitobacterium hafniense TaxID=49338 RepID=UPI0003684B80|nr:LysR family transcriptional regulator [Desulfitobacterium hafniense]
MEIKQLYYFVEVVKHGSFVKAAETLFITPQALSKSISHIEKEYNCRLFIRKNNNLLLSDTGRQLLEDAKVLLDYYCMIDQRIKQLAEIENASFQVAVPQCALNMIDDKLFKKFKQLYPQLNPDYLEMPDKMVDEYMEADRVEACFNINDLPNQHEYESLLVCPTELCVMTFGSNKSLNNKKFVTLKDLTNQRIALKGELYKSFDILEKASEAENITLNYELKSSDDALLLDSLTSSGCVGIGICAYHEASKHIEHSAVPFKPSLPWNIYFSYKKHKLLSKPMQLFIKFVKENYAYTPAETNTKAR